MALPFFTIGHSTHAFDEFVALLREARVELVADIRTVPRSRTNPQFNQDVMPDALADVGMSYEHIAALGGLRSKSKIVAREVNGHWENDSFHNYADYAISESFRAGLDHLIDVGRRKRSVIMCSEAVWWRCHRRIVADHLIARGETVFHIMAAGRIETAHLTPGAVIKADLNVVYPPA